jgi:hypothetical protein
VCDASAFIADPYTDSPDYLIDVQTNYFICTPVASNEYLQRFPLLDYSDTTFIAKFGRPDSFNTQDGEVWRLYSLASNVGGKKIEIFVGHREKAPSKMVETLSSQIGIVDAGLAREAASIARSRSDRRSVARTGSRAALSIDGFQVVDDATNAVEEWGEWLPSFLPKDIHLPSTGLRPLVFNSRLYLVQSDTDAAGRLLATSLVEIGDLAWIGISCIFAFLATTIVAGGLGRRFLRNYFAIVGARVPTLREAQRSGEGQGIEFKRGLSEDEARAGSVEDELLKSIAAFANTNDGVIFIGVDDAGRVKGLRLDFQGRDRFERKIRQLVRNRIRPKPPIQVAFEEAEDLLIAKIVVARGDGVHMMGGVVYARDGSSDVQAQPEDLIRILQYAF